MTNAAGSSPVNIEHQESMHITRRNLSPTKIAEKQLKIASEIITLSSSESESTSSDGSQTRTDLFHNPDLCLQEPHQVCRSIHLDSGKAVLPETTQSFSSTRLGFVIESRCSNPDPDCERIHPKQAQENNGATVTPSEPVAVFTPKVIRTSPPARHSDHLTPTPFVVRPQAVKTQTPELAITQPLLSGRRRVLPNPSNVEHLVRDSQILFPETLMVPPTSRMPLHPTEAQHHQLPTQHGYAAAINGTVNQQMRPGHQPRVQQLQQRQNNMTSPSASQSSSISRQRGLGQSRTGSLSQGSDGSITGLHPTPLFQRLVCEEVQELKSYARIIESQNRRLAELERVHGDLEARLELQSTGRMDIERTLEDRELEWAERIAELEKETEHWKALVDAERTKNARLMERVVRKDQDIHRMLQRKYDNKKENHNLSVRSVRQLGSSTDRISSLNGKTSAVHGDQRMQHRSPHEILQSSGSAEAIRERNVSNALLDFFGM